MAPSPGRAFSALTVRIACAAAAGVLPEGDSESATCPAQVLLLSVAGVV